MDPRAFKGAAHVVDGSYVAQASQARSVHASLIAELIEHVRAHLIQTELINLKMIENS